MSKFRDYSLETLKACLENKEHVLFDGSWYTDLESLHVSCKKYSVLVYCSFHEMIKRIARRRQNAVECSNAIDHRFFCEGMRAFTKHYWITPEKEGAIDTISLDEVKEALQLVESLLEPAQPSVKKKFIVQEFTREEFNKFKEDLLAIFVDCEKLYVVPKKKYDLVLKTDRLDSHECAKKIFEFNDSRFS